MFTAIFFSPTPESGSLVNWSVGSLVPRVRCAYPGYKSRWVSDRVRDDEKFLLSAPTLALPRKQGREMSLPRYGAQPGARRQGFARRVTPERTDLATRYGAEDENFDSMPQPAAPSQGFATIPTPERTFGA